MKENVTQEMFWEEFAVQLRCMLQKDPNWKDKYKSNKRWTKVIYKLIKEHISKSLNYSGYRQCSTEYLRTDIGFYDIDNCNKEIDLKYNGFEWDFDVAIEHENDETSWLDEFVKLIHVNCGLKVIISYHDYSKNGQTENILSIAEAIYNNRKYKNLNDNWIIILGPCLKDMKEHDFVAFKSVINKETGIIKFEKLEDNKIIL